MMNNGNGEHWLVRGLNGINVLTLIGVVLAVASLYYQLDKDIALMKRDIADIESKLTRIEQQLSGRKPAPYAWPPAPSSAEKS